MSRPLGQRIAWAFGAISALALLALAGWACTASAAERFANQDPFGEAAAPATAAKPATPAKSKPAAKVADEDPFADSTVAKAAAKPAPAKPSDQDPFAAGPSPAKTKPAGKTPPLDPGMVLGLKTPAPEKPLAHGEAEIEKALRSPTRMEFQDTPLNEVVAYLTRLHGVSIKLDRRAMDEASIATDQPVTIDLGGASLEAALDLMLGDLGLTWTIDCEVLVITTPEALDGRAITRVYRVPESLTTPEATATIAGPTGHPMVLAPPIRTGEIAKLVATHAVREDAQPDGKSSFVSEASVGGVPVLVVTHNYRVQRRVKQLLEDLSEVASKHSGKSGPRMLP
jgi:hypothetical protein